ncbi:DUF4186 domain-containing protein [Floccifex sp.]|uniref:DUF4186 domain-containing protein n=1 Tax=Floccifex sp. TaxID=2815810 RepID=UPI002A753DF8|nr:DUF4186 domain-containing protein [Floccifex sp.]MDD7281307.1 DUF4186 domain-containing protein [Erysipelotrichaceae bacterium]MDY2958805.1 DUF4186 domain-containing protein [Floccifex sp.]
MVIKQDGIYTHVLSENISEFDKNNIIIYSQEPLKVNYAYNGYYNCPFEWKKEKFVCVDLSCNKSFDFDHLLKYRTFCIQNHCSFIFYKTSEYLKVNGKMYHIDSTNQIAQARKANIDFIYYPIFDRLLKSEFRSSFHLNKKDIQYIHEKGIHCIKQHAYDFVKQKLKNKLENDGKQTPMKGHPVFKAMHACACCCRSCLYKWHKIETDHVLNENEIDYIVNVLMSWVDIELAKTN